MHNSVDDKCYNELRSLLEEIRTTKLVFRSNANASFVSPVLIRGNYQSNFDSNSKYNRSSIYLNNNNNNDKQILPITMPYSSYVPSYLNSYTNKSYTRGLTNSTDYLNKPYNTTYQTSLTPYGSYRNLEPKETPKSNSSWVGSQNESFRTNQEYQSNYETKSNANTGYNNTSNAEKNNIQVVCSHSLFT